LGVPQAPVQYSTCTYAVGRLSSGYYPSSLSGYDASLQQVIILLRPKKKPKENFFARNLAEENFFAHRRRTLNAKIAHCNTSEIRG
jgi:hypothetical protein